MSVLWERACFSGDASEWRDESRYVELSLGCCVSMTEQIGWRRAQYMTHEAKTAELCSRLRSKWNTRAALAQQPEPAQEPFALPCPTPKACREHCCSGHCIPYTAPPQRPPLTDEEILSVLRLAPPEPSLWPHLKDEAVVGDVQRAVLAIARVVEQAHGIKE